MLKKIGKAIGGIAKKAKGLLNPGKMLKKLAGGGLGKMLMGALGMGGLGIGGMLAGNLLKNLLGGGQGKGLLEGLTNGAQQRGLTNLSYTNINMF